jgi:hypothetical protein
MRMLLIVLPQQILPVVVAIGRAYDRVNMLTIRDFGIIDYLA